MRNIKAACIILAMFTTVSCNTPDINAEPVSNTVVEDDFELTIISSQREYSLDELFATTPLDIYAEFKYIGQDDEINIIHGTRIGCINLVRNNGVPVIPVEIGAIAVPVAI